MSRKKPNISQRIDSQITPSSAITHHTRAAKQRSKYLKQLRTSQRSLDRFKNLDLPEFEQWRSTTFGKLISEIFSLHDQLNQIVDQIEPQENLHFEHSAHFRDAYNSTRKSHQKTREENTNPLKKSNLTEEEHATNITEFKKTYRSLVRKLHPDHRDDTHSLNPTRLDELWHTTQKAYVSGVLKELQHLEQLIESEVNLDTEETDLERIKQLTEQHRIALRTVQHSLKTARTHPAWMFSKDPSIKAELEPLFLQELQNEILLIKKDISVCQQRIAKQSAH